MHYIVYEKTLILLQKDTILNATILNDLFRFAILSYVFRICGFWHA
jgi:hypothetical protein